MATLTELNLEQGMPTAAEALTLLQGRIRRYASSRDVCMIIIHGYGSSGKGGVIRDKTRQWLSAQKRNGKLSKVVFGENFSIFDADSRELKAKYPRLAEHIDRGNHGITIIEL